MSNKCDIVIAGPGPTPKLDSRAVTAIKRQEVLQTAIDRRDERIRLLEDMLERACGVIVAHEDMSEPIEQAARECAEKIVNYLCEHYVPYFGMADVLTPIILVAMRGAATGTKDARITALEQVRVLREAGKHVTETLDIRAMRTALAATSSEKKEGV